MGNWTAFGLKMSLLLNAIYSNCFVALTLFFPFYFFYNHIQRQRLTSIKLLQVNSVQLTCCWICPLVVCTTICSPVVVVAVVYCSIAS